MKNISGGVDCKFTNFDLISKMSSAIISGPSTENNPNLPIFEWTSELKSLKHKGLPEKFDFGWYLASPENIKDNNLQDKFNFK
jgi:hypothetical protein